MPDQLAPTPSAEPWPELVIRALEGLLPPDVSLERLLDRIERRAADQP